MKQSLYIFFCIWILSLIGLDAAYALAPSDNNVCTINSEQVHVEIKSLYDVTYTVEREMTFYNRHRRLQTFVVDYDEVSKIKSANIIFFNASGKKIKSISKKELQDMSAVSGSTIYTYSRLVYADLEMDTYPYSVKISYEKQYKELTRLPTWSPQEFNSKLISASYTVKHSANLPVHHKTMNADFVFAESNHGDEIKKQWQLKDLKAIDKERYMPNSVEILPQLICVPEQFTFGGYEGSYGSWEDYSHYMWQLNKDRDVLSDTQKKIVDDICQDLETDREKIDALYQYMQNETRYVSVQLGVGGWQTFDANYVEQNKFGDCKALSNFMKAMLKHVGIKSNMIVISMGRNYVPLKQDLVFPNMNHMILYVPEEELWLECTSRYGPSNYVGASIEDRNCLLVEDHNGGLIKTPKAPESVCSRRQEIKLQEDGSAKCTVQLTESGTYQESLRYYFKTKSESELKEMFYEEFEIKNFDILDFDYSATKNEPVTERNFDLSVSDYAAITGKRYFVPVSLLEHDYYLLTATDRALDLHFRTAVHELDTITIDIPESLVVESMPNPHYEIETPYGKYNMHIESAEHQFTIYRELEIYKSKYPVSEYQEVKDFMKQIRKLDNAKLVLKSL